MKIFLSHSNHDDDQEVMRLVQVACKVLNIDLYIAEKDRQPGNYLAPKVWENMARSDEFLVIHTPNSAKSDSVNQEIGRANDPNRPNKLVYLAEDFNSLSALQKGIEGFKLDRNDLVTSITNVMIYFRDKLPKPSVPTRKANEKLVDSDNPDIFFRLWWDPQYDPISQPDKVQLAGRCKIHGIELTPTRDLYGGRFWGCETCGKPLTEANLRKLMMSTKGHFLMGTKPQRKKALVDVLGLEALNCASCGEPGRQLDDCPKCKRKICKMCLLLGRAKGCKKCLP